MASTVKLCTSPPRPNADNSEMDRGQEVVSGARPPAWGLVRQGTTEMRGRDREAGERAPTYASEHARDAESVVRGAIGNVGQQSATALSIAMRCKKGTATKIYVRWDGMGWGEMGERWNETRGHRDMFIA